jgi:hypothetical protein
MILACFEVYNEMGTGFIEPVYQECLDLNQFARIRIVKAVCKGHDKTPIDKLASLDTG